jgi:hypothetical protein
VMVMMDTVVDVLCGRMYLRCYCPFLKEVHISCELILSSDSVVRFCPQNVLSTFIEPSATNKRKRVGD